MKLSTITAPPATVSSRHGWSEAKLRKMQRDLNAGVFPGNFPDIDWPEEINIEGDAL
jgi:hypothetical protein